MRKLSIILSVMCGLGAVQASAQMSVTSLGSSNGAMCYENASNALASDTEPCDLALREPSITRSDLKKTLVNRGIIRNRNGAFVAAIADFDAALAIDPDLGEAYLNRGNSYYLQRQYDDALADYERALALNVSRPWAAWYNIGLVHEARRAPEAARSAYQKALDLNPDFALAQEKLTP